MNDAGFTALCCLIVGMLVTASYCVGWERGYDIATNTITTEQCEAECGEHYVIDRYGCECLQKVPVYNDCWPHRGTCDVQD